LGIRPELKEELENKLIRETIKFGNEEDDSLNEEEEASQGRRKIYHNHC